MFPWWHFDLDTDAVLTLTQPWIDLDIYYRYTSNES